MRIGISLTSGWGTTPPRAAATAMIERASVAYGAGFDSLSLGDHHGVPSNYVQNTPMLGRLMAEWPDREVGALFLLPLWNPVLVAEHIGTLAALTDARFVAQVGIGSGQRQFDSMGASLRTRGVVTDESIRVIQALLAGDEASSERLNVSPTRLGMRPANGVDWWIGGHSPAALRRAAAMGDVWYTGPVLGAEARELIDVYRQYCTEVGKTPRMVARRDVLVLADAERAGRLGVEAIENGYRGGYGIDQILVGGPEEAAADSQRLADLGFEAVMIRCVSSNQDVALETIEIMGGASAQS